MGAIQYQCAKCGEMHEGLPAIGFAEPAYIYAIPTDDRKGRVKLSDDLCTADEHYFIRCVLKVPIVGHDEAFEWGVWCSASQASFERYVDSFDDHDQSKLGGWFGYLCNGLPSYRDTQGLHCNVHPQDDRKRPLVELQDGDHALVHDQRSGISMERAMEFVGLLENCVH